MFFFLYSYYYYFIRSEPLSASFGMWDSAQTCWEGNRASILTPTVMGRRGTVAPSAARRRLRSVRAAPPAFTRSWQLPGVQSAAALLQLRRDAARLRGFTFITLDVTGPPGQGWRGGPFCKSRTSHAWERQRWQTRGVFRRFLLRRRRRRSKLTFCVDSVTTAEKRTPSSAEPNPYLEEWEPARTVHCVGRVVEHSVPI